MGIRLGEALVTALCLLFATKTPALASRILIEKNVEARMRDGVILRADVYRPDTTGKLPALLERTPPHGREQVDAPLEVTGPVVAKCRSAPCGARRACGHHGADRQGDGGSH